MLLIRIYILIIRTCVYYETYRLIKSEFPIFIVAAKVPQVQLLAQTSGITVGQVIFVLLVFSIALLSEPL